jgi:hypothetical protein
MSFRSKISNSQDYNYNKSPHIYSYKHGWINTIVHFFLNTFIKSTKLPFISISLFIVVIILNTIQYNNDNKYLQTQVEKSISYETGSTSFNNILLYIYDVIGINGFIMNGLPHILFFILTYICLALIELNIGHIAVLLFLIILLMFQFFIGGFSNAICENIKYGSGRLLSSPYCCGSFILFASLGFVLFIIQKHINDLYSKFLIWIIIAGVWFGCILYENYYTYALTEPSESKTCSLFFWHATNFLLGIFSALVLAK